MLLMQASFNRDSLKVFGKDALYLPGKTIIRFFYWVSNWYL